MTKQNDKRMEQNEKTIELQAKLSQLEQKLQEKRNEHEQTEAKLMKLEQEFNAVKKSKIWLHLNPAKVKQTIRSVGAFLLGRRNPKRLYSPSYKRKQAQNDLKKYKYHLYDLGFTDQALKDLEQLYDETTNRYLLRAIAWELALYYANDYSKIGAEQALSYLKIALDGEKDIDQMRRIAIIKAECYDILGHQNAGKKVIHAMLAEQEHPDLYFALANLEKTIAGRFQYFNLVMKYFNLAPITFRDGGQTYDDIQTVPINRTFTDGPKVSVIIPAYHAEVGIQTAIESIQSQTWRNLEILIVDDCSPDNTLAVIQSYAEKDKRIKVFSTPGNSGPYVARNIALKEATGEFVTINDADDWSHREKIEKQVRHLMNHDSVIANTSGHARLTEQLKAYRRGTPGTYIFPNMSSLMFRREPVTEKLGYWDSVRFAADGEFKRRLIKAFGKEAVVDLPTGPLSLPRQSVTSLTASSAFGYNGFFMGARKEYVESFTAYHQATDTLYYPYPQKKRLFPVPEPMWPTRAKNRRFDVIIAADFYSSNASYQTIIAMIETNKRLGLRTGIIQMATYGTHHKRKIAPSIRQMINGEDVQVIVYGEKIKCDIIIVQQPLILQYKQKYIPKVKANVIAVIIPDVPKAKGKRNYHFRDCSRNLMDYFGLRGIWFPANQNVRQHLFQHDRKELRFISIARENWLQEDGFHADEYQLRLDQWFVDDLDV